MLKRKMSDEDIMTLTECTQEFLEKEKEFVLSHEQ